MATDFIGSILLRIFSEGLELALSGRVSDSNAAFGTAEKLVGPQAWARYARGRAFVTRYTQNALENFELASSLPGSPSEVRNEFAWPLANHPEKELREPLRAERITRGLLTEWPQTGEFWGTRPRLSSIAALATFGEATRHVPIAV